MTDIIISQKEIAPLIHTIRDKQVILDTDLAMLYQVETKALNRVVKRNENRFPETFCFQLGFGKRQAPQRKGHFLQRAGF